MSARLWIAILTQKETHTLSRYPWNKSLETHYFYISDTVFAVIRSAKNFPFFWLAAGPHERWLCNAAGSVLRVLWITPAGTVENLVKQLRPLAFHRKWENTTTENMGKYRNIWHMWGIGKQRWGKRGKDMIASLSYLYYVWLHGLFNLFLVEAYVFFFNRQRLL